MARPTPKRSPRQGPYFKKPAVGKDAIVRLVKPSSDDPDLHVWAGHGFHIEDPEAKGGKRWVNAFCLGTPSEPDAPGLTDDGVSRCLTLGPIGESGSFLHDFEYDWYFNCFLFVHSFEGVMVNKLQVWSQRQGATDGGVYAQLDEALRTAEDAGKRASQVLLKIRGMQVKNFPDSRTVSVSYIGVPEGKYADYDLTDRMKASALEEMGKLRTEWDPRMDEAGLRKLLGLGGRSEPDDDDDPFDGGGAEFDSGLDAHPKQDSELP